MVFDVVTAIGVGIGIGAALGAFSAYLGWNASGEPFNTKKFIAGLSTGVIAGVGTMALAIGPIKASLSDTSGAAFAELMIVVGLSIVGVDMVRSKISGAIENRATESKTVVVEEPKPT